MTATREQIVAECRTYIGTPYRHQGRLKHVGVDCAGMLENVALLFDLAPGYNHEDGTVCRTNYDRNPDGTLEALLRQHMVRVPLDERLPGDVALMSWIRTPHHIAVFSTPDRIIHAWNRINQRGSTAEGKVVEVSYGEAMRSRTRAVYRFKGLD